jgi:hypothetical protein
MRCSAVRAEFSGFSGCGYEDDPIKPPASAVCFISTTTATSQDRHHASEELAPSLCWL